MLGSRFKTARQRLVRVSSSEEKENSSFFRRELPIGEVGWSSLTPEGYLEEAEMGVDVFERLTTDPEPEAAPVVLEGEAPRRLAELGRKVAALVAEEPTMRIGTGSLRGAGDLGDEEVPILREEGGVDGAALLKPDAPRSEPAELGIFLEVRWLVLFDGVRNFTLDSDSLALDSACESASAERKEAPLRGSKDMRNLYEFDLLTSAPVSVSLPYEFDDRSEDERDEEARVALRGDRGLSSIDVLGSVASDDAISPKLSLIGALSFLLDDLRITTVELVAAVELSRIESGNNPVGFTSNVAIGVDGMDSNFDKSSSNPRKVGNLPKVEAGTGVEMASNGSDFVPELLGSVCSKYEI